jgi:putative salt-induced outer membrane protein
MKYRLRRSARQRGAAAGSAGLEAALVFALALAWIPLARAEGACPDVCAEAVEEDTGPWSGDVSLGYLATTGNTETSNAKFGFGVDYTIDRWVHGLTGTAMGASEDNETTAEAYSLGWKSTYDLSDRNYLFGRANWLKDRFSGYDYQLTETLGYGRRVIMDPDQTLNLEIAPGARQAETSEGDEQNEAILRLAAEYQYIFNENAELDFDLGVETGADNTFTEAILGLKTKLVGSLAAVLAYTVRNNTDVPDDTEKTDTMTSVSLEYSF